MGTAAGFGSWSQDFAWHVDTNQSSGLSNTRNPYGGSQFDFVCILVWGVSVVLKQHEAARCTLRVAPQNPPFAIF